MKLSQVMLLVLGVVAVGVALCVLVLVPHVPLWGTALLLVLLGGGVALAVWQFGGVVHLDKRLRDSVAVAGVVVGIVATVLALRPGGVAVNDEDAQQSPTPSTSSPDITSERPSSASETPWSSPSVEANPVPLQSPSPKRTIMQWGEEALVEGNSMLTGSGLRIGVSGIYGSFVSVNISTDNNICTGYLDVGETMVMAEGVTNDLRLDSWHSVTLTRLQDGEASVQWQAGAGPYPASSERCLW